MALILQFQRRAIESLRSRMVKPRHPIESIYSLWTVLSDNLVIGDVRPLTILGISKGVGTCSDVSGMDVLVLSDNRRSQPSHKLTLAQINNCAYAVLVRQASRKEAEGKSFTSAVNVACVELLRLTDIASKFTKFQTTGHRAYYAVV